MFVLFRSVRGRNSSPFSTCRSTLGVSCPLWSHPSWEVSVHNPDDCCWWTYWGLFTTCSLLLTLLICTCRWCAVFRRWLLRSGLRCSCSSDGRGFRWVFIQLQHPGRCRRHRGECWDSHWLYCTLSAVLNSCKVLQLVWHTNKQSDVLLPAFALILKGYDDF